MSQNGLLKNKGQDCKILVKFHGSRSLLSFLGNLGRLAISNLLQSRFGIKISVSVLQRPEKV